MKLIDLLKDIDYTLIQGNINLNIKDITYNSKLANKDTLFIALKGFRVDGHTYINNAISNGCNCIIVEDDIEVNNDITVIKVKNTREDLRKISRTLFNYPDKELIKIGITGTKGKTTTSYIIKTILDKNNMDCGLIGTMGVFFKDKYYHTVNTSPESYDVFKYMREMLNNGIKYFVMEVSSQSLKLNRWNDILFDYAIFTNLSLDHVGEDEHDSFDDYKYCKSKLFKQCKIGIFNIDNEYSSYMIDKSKCKVITYGYNNKADYKILNTKNILNSNFMGIEFNMDGKLKENIIASLPGEFNTYNVASAITLCNELNIDINKIKEILKDINVRGRLEKVNISNKFNIIIDYAYQGIAMENVLKTIKQINPKRIVNVFGCGGNRSKQRRYDCGEVSGKYADLSIITSDNPRYEDNNDIVKDILIGMNKTTGKYIIINDRKEAIKYSIKNAKDGDIIMILGKGHEDYQEINGERHPFDERIIINDIVKQLTKEERKKLGIL